MKSAINTVRWLLSIIFGMILSLIVLISPLAISISTTISNRETLKGWVNQSGIYQNTDELAIQFIKEQARSSSENQDLDKAEEIIAQHHLEEIVKDVLTPAFSQNIIEGAIDGAYDYLEGKTEGIVIKADKEKVQDAFLQILVAQSGLEYDSVDQIRNLPTCTPAQEENLEDGFESIEDACLPEGLVLDQIFESQFGQGDDTGQLDITSGGVNTEEIEGHFPAREVFQTMRLLPYLLLSAIVALTALTIIFNPSLKTSLIFTGIMGAVPSLLSAGLASLIYFSGSTSNAIAPLISDLDNQSTLLFEESSKVVLKDIFGKDILYSLLLLVLFGAIIASSRLVKVSQENTVPTEKKG